MSDTNEPETHNFRQSLIAGAAGGLVVDISLFPLDTLKTRLQSRNGFWGSGGFSGVYKGVVPAAVGSAPQAAAFFVTYNGIKNYMSPIAPVYGLPFVHMFSASLAEVMCAVAKVPVEVIKQRRQANVGVAGRGSLDILRNTLSTEGPRGLYRGFFTTILRDVPFSIIQFPLWEYFKRRVGQIKGRPTPFKNRPTPFEGALCGAVAGSIAGAVTTPLDVAKTRIMLTEGRRKDLPRDATRMWPVLKTIYLEGGVKGLFAGFIPRTVWIFLGGSVFFGVYEKICKLV